MQHHSYLSNQGAVNYPRSLMNLVHLLKLGISRGGSENFIRAGTKLRNILHGFKMHPGQRTFKRTKVLWRSCALEYLS